MFNVTPLEVLTIAVLALVLFGPRRLPEIARRVGDFAREMRRAAEDFRDGLNREYEEFSRPIHEVRQEAERALEGVNEPLKKGEESEPVGGPGEVEEQKDHAAESPTAPAVQEKQSEGERPSGS